jgi:hypothetical protein
VFQRKIGIPIRLIFVVIIGGVFAGYVASTVRSTWASSWVHFGDSAPSVMPLSNAAAKSDRLAALMRSAVTIPQHRNAVAATTSADLDRFFGMVTAAAPMMPTESVQAAEPAEAQAAVQTAVTSQPAATPAPAKPKPAPPMGLLDDGQIAGIKARLRLTPEQSEHWPAVETALRAVAKMQLREMRRNRNSSGKINIDVNSPEVQQLIWAAMPLLGQLREDQKTEVRRLVRVIGLEQVASRI